MTEAQLARRRKHITATDPAQIFGLAPGGRGPLHVYYGKMGQLEPAKETAPMEMGNWLEAPLIEYAAKELGVKVDRRGRFRVSREKPLFACTLDGPIVGKPEAIESKYVGPFQLDEWGEAGTAQVPAFVAMQCQIQAYVAELKLVWVPVFVALYRPERRLYCVPRDDELIGMMLTRLHVWWAEHIIRQVPPAINGLPPLDLLRRLKREPKTSIPVPPKLMRGWKQVHRLKSVSNKLAKRADAAILAAMGTAEAADGGEAGVVTYLQQTIKAHQRAESTFRVLRVKK